MAGFCGVVSRNEINTDDLENMIGTMGLCAPVSNASEKNVFCATEWCVGMAGQPDVEQPMCSVDQNVSIVFYGKIYNGSEIRAKLDYPFSFQSDTETVIAAYLKWGMDCMSHFNGAFSFALYDRRTDELFLVRDRIGGKPLFYWLQDGNIVFATELKPIMAYPGFPKEVRKEILPRYLYQISINAPDTVFENTWKVEPGHFLRFRKGQVDNKTWWNLVEVYHEKRRNQVTNYSEAKSELKEKLLRAISLRMTEGEAVGTFLSGGYDSTMITALTQSMSDKPVKTFSIGFTDKTIDEAPFARAIAKHLGTDHMEFYLSDGEMLRQVESISTYYDEPFADSSQIATMVVSKLARESVPVALSGDAGDEFFCGYSTYAYMRKAQILDFPGAVVNLVGKLPLGSDTTLLDKLPRMVKIIARNRNPETKTQFGGKNYIDAGRKMAGYGVPELFPVEIALHEPNWQRRRMLLDMTNYLPGDCLVKVERAAAKYALDVRCPIMDVNVMEYSFSLRQDFKYYHGEKKRILKDIVHDYVPYSLLDRPKKGFGVPIDSWLHGPLKEQLISYSRMNVLRKQGLFHPEETERFIDAYLSTRDTGAGSGANFSKTAWAFYIFQHWYTSYIASL